MKEPEARGISHTVAAVMFYLSSFTKHHMILRFNPIGISDIHFANLHSQQICYGNLINGIELLLCFYEAVKNETMSFIIQSNQSLHHKIPLIPFSFVLIESNLWPVNKGKDLQLQL